MKNKTLFIHIGHYKTGTTALQVFCWRNIKVLEARGLSYSRRLEHNAKHSVLAFSLFRAAGVTSFMHGYNRDGEPEEYWHDLFEEVRSSKTDRFLVSTEELMRLGEFPEAVERLKNIIATDSEGIDFKIVAYLRPPKDQLSSWYNQIVKMRHRVGEFDSALANGRIEGIHYDYYRALKPWIDIFGKEAIELRRYPDRSQPRSAIFSDFFGILGVDTSDIEIAFLDEANPRLDDRAVDLIRHVQNAGVERDEIDDLRQRLQAYVKSQYFKPAGGAGIQSAQAQMDEGLARLGTTMSDDFSDLGAPIHPRSIGPDVESVAFQVGFVQSELLRLERKYEAREARRFMIRVRKVLRRWRTALKRLWR